MSLSTGSGTVEGAISPDCPVLDPGLFFARIIGGLEIPLGGASVPEKLPSNGRMGVVSRAELPAFPGGPSLPLRAPTATGFAAEPARHLVGQQHREFTKSDDVIGASRVDRRVARR